MSTAVQKPIIEPKANPLSFIVRPKGYVIVNATEDRIEVRCAGMGFYVPPKSEFHNPDEPRLMHSYKDPQTGKPMPGTLLLVDVVERGSLVLKTLWNSEAAVIHVFGVDMNSGLPSSDYFLRGLGVVPEGATREEVEATRTAGVVRARKWAVRTAYGVVNSHNLKNEARKRANLGEVPPDRGTARSMMVIQALQEEEIAAMKAEFPILAERESAQTRGAAPENMDTRDLMVAIAANPDLMKMLKTAMRADDSSKGSSK